MTLANVIFRVADGELSITGWGWLSIILVGLLLSDQASR